MVLGPVAPEGEMLSNLLHSIGPTVACWTGPRRAASEDDDVDAYLFSALQGCLHVSFQALCVY